MATKIFGVIFVLSLVGIVLVIFQGGATAAGQVVFVSDYRTPGSSQVLTFNNPASLKVFQANLQPGRPDYYAFQGTKDTIVQIKLDTLRLVGQDNFAPSLALFGPGLPAVTPDELPLFPFSLPGGNGLLVSAESTPLSTTVQSRELPDRYDEPWTQTGYWERQSLLNQLPEDGTYYLVVYSLDQQSGKYGLFVGDKPEAGLRETLTFPITWLRLHYWFEDLWWPTFALVVLALAIVGLLYLQGQKLWWRFGRPRVYAARNERRSALLTKKKRHAWDNRRINRTPTASGKQVSSNDIISRLLTHTGGYDFAHLRPETAPDFSMPVESSPKPVAVSPENWEGTEKAATTTVTATPVAVVTTTTAEPEESDEPEVNPSLASREDGLSEWGKRFHPKG